MSGGDSSEEKNLPPSERTLRKAREKGQVASSKDFVTAFVTISAIAYIVFAWQIFTRLFTDGFHLSVSAMQRDFADTYRALSAEMVIDLAVALGPLLAVVFLAAILSNILHKDGIPFSIDPIIPKFEKLNPFSGFKKIFGFRSLVEFGVSLFRLMLWFVVATIILWLSLSDILNSTQCGLRCVLVTGFSVFAQIVLAAVILMILASLLDLPMQVSLFKREKRMTHSQMKQEQKENSGSPEIKSRRREIHREILDGIGSNRNAKGQVMEPTFVIYGAGKAVAIYFDITAQQVPFVVAKGQQELATSIMDSGERLKIPLEENAVLTEKIFRRTNIGSPVHEETFEDLVQLIIKHGLV